jgi:hypothetical protein
MRRHGILQITALLTGIVVLCAAAAGAQSWAGNASLGMTVRANTGRPLANATVTIAYRDVGFGDGPAPRLTTAQGEVAFAGLAEGRWSVKIDHPEYLSYLATLVVRSEKKAEVLSEFLEATGEGRLTMRVKQTKGPSENIGVQIEPTERLADDTKTAAAGAVAPSLPGTTSPSLGETATSEPMEPAGPIAAPAEGSGPSAEVSDETTPTASADTGVDEPESDIGTIPPGPEEAQGAASEPLPEPATPPSEQHQADPSEGAAEEVGDVAEPPADPQAGVATTIAEKTAATDAPSGPHPEDTPEASPEGDELAGTAVGPSGPTPAREEKPAGRAPGPAPAAATPTSPGDGPVFPPAELTSFQNRNCLECRPGEWAVSVSSEVETLSPSSCEVSKTEVGESLRRVAIAERHRLDGYWGPVPSDGIALPESLAELLRDHSCRLMAVVLPRGARFAGFRLQATDAGGNGDCSAGRSCPIGDAEWLFEPSDIEEGGATIVFSVFRNAAATVTRTATMTVYFAPGVEWLESRETTD